MFGSSSSEKQKLEEQYKKLSDEAYRLSHSNRRKSDEKRAEAEAIGKQLDELEQQQQ